MFWSADIRADEGRVFPAWGADAVPDLYAPSLAGPGAFIASTGGAPHSAINPAQGGQAERIVFDIGYMGLAGLQSEEGYGNIINMGMLFPTRYGVFGGSLRLIQSPFAEFPVKWAFSANLSAAKEVFPRMSVGAGLNLGVGEDSIWILSGDLGFRYNMGKIGPFENFTWAAVLRSMGKSWTPTWFTPMGGVSFDLFRLYGEEGKPDPFAVTALADLSLPSIINFNYTSLILKMGLQANIAETIRVSLSWPGGSGLNARELSDGVHFNPIPSVGVGFNIVMPSGGRRVAGGRLPSDGDMAIDMAYKPLYEGVTAIGAGAAWSVGMRSRRPPVINIDFPEPFDPANPPPEGVITNPVYFSPNNDGRADVIEFDFSISTDRYVASWVWEIFNEEGNTVRTIRNT